MWPIFFQRATLSTGIWTQPHTANSASYTNNVPFQAFKHRTMAKHIAAHINAFVYGRRGKSRKAEEKKRDKQSLAALPLHLSGFFFLLFCITLKKEKKKIPPFHHQIQADLYASGVKQTNIIFSVSRL